MHLFANYMPDLGRLRRFLRAMRGRPIPMRLPDRHCRRYGHGFCRHQLAPPSAPACRTVYVLYRPWGIAILSFLPEDTRLDVANRLREQRRAIEAARAAMVDALVAQIGASACVH